VSFADKVCEHPKLNDSVVAFLCEHTFYRTAHLHESLSCNVMYLYSKYHLNAVSVCTFYKFMNMH
jgi:hypothetical protein